MPRPRVEHIHAPQIAPIALAWPGWPPGAAVKPLSRDEGSGAISCLLVLPDGWRRPRASPVSDCEILVTSGMLRVDDHELPAASYSFVPAAAPDGEWLACGPTEVFFAARTGPPDLRPAADATNGSEPVRLPASRLPWGPTPIPDGPPNIEVAMLRRTETGEMSALVRGGPRRFPVWEFHECVEECFLLDGEIMIEPGGQMRAGTYFWRPPYFTHGHSRCDTSSLLYVYTDSTLVNHVADRLDRTPDENREQLARSAAGG